MTANAVAIAQPSLLSTLRAYVALTKPVIIVLLLITTVPAMMLAQGGWPSTWLVIATLIGGTLSAGGANAINCWYDRDIDSIMTRTRARPLVAGLIEPAHALTFGIGLGAAAFVFLAITTTLAAALISLGALLFYVLIYTMWLKRRTPQNIVIGGAAGAFPPMVGWAAVTGDVGIPSLILFAIVFFWTPPHFWALALRLKDDYQRAGVPMLPVTHGPAETRRQIWIYSWILVATALVLPFFSDIGWTYSAVAAGTGAWLLVLAWRLYRHPESESPMRLYLYSLLYLALLFVGVGLDVMIGI